MAKPKLATAQKAQNESAAFVEKVRLYLQKKRELEMLESELKELRPIIQEFAERNRAALFGEGASYKTLDFTLTFKKSPAEILFDRKENEVIALIGEDPVYRHSLLTPKINKAAVEEVFESNPNALKALGIVGLRRGETFEIRR